MQRVLFCLFLPLFLAGCPTQEPYATCGLDEEVTSKKVCDGTGGTASSTGTTTTCVVTQHPHCIKSVCLSFFNRPPVCTKVCATDSDCPLGGMCFEFSEKENNKFCVPRDQFCSVNKTAPQCAGG
jgi:hypothetical protein